MFWNMSMSFAFAVNWPRGKVDRFTSEIRLEASR